MSKGVTPYEIPKYDDDAVNDDPHMAELSDKKPSSFARWMKASEKKIEKENEEKSKKTKAPFIPIKDNSFRGF